LTDEAEKRDYLMKFRQEWLEFQKGWKFLKSLIFSKWVEQLEYSYKVE
jgi:hypothetical protein